MITSTQSLPQTPAQALPDQDELVQRLLSDTPLLADTPDHLLQVVNVLESYGLVLDAYSRNLIHQGNTQLSQSFSSSTFFSRRLFLRSSLVSSSW